MGFGSGYFSIVHEVQLGGIVAAAKSCQIMPNLANKIEHSLSGGLRCMSCLSLQLAKALASNLYKLTSSFPT